MSKRTYEVHMKDWHGDDDFALVEARYHEQAAEDWAEEHWGGDPCDPSNLEYEITVTDVETREIKKYNVTAEATVNFYANEV